jgi:hypothetical protein
MFEKVNDKVKLLNELYEVQHSMRDIQRSLSNTKYSKEMDELIMDLKAMILRVVFDEELDGVSNARDLEIEEDDSEPKYCEDCCDCRTCKYYEEGPIQWGFADGEQVFGEGMCHEDDRMIVRKATGHKPCPVWKSVNDTSPEIDYP